MGALERFDPFADARNRLRAIAHHAGEWAGIPVPIEGEELVIEPSYQFAEIFNRRQEEPPAPDFKLRNTFHSTWRRCDVHVFEEPDGRVTYGVTPVIHHLQFDLRTLGCSVAWGIEQEAKAVNLLGTLIRHHAFKSYLLTGMFLETSKRSGVTYLFRRLKPTVAIVSDWKKDSTRVLCALCMHPVAHYAGSWAGGMCPTDDLLAHLMLMRADEHLYWKRCSQHPPHRPEAGL